MRKSKLSKIQRKIKSQKRKNLTVAEMKQRRKVKIKKEQHKAIVAVKKLMKDHPANETQKEEVKETVQEIIVEESGSVGADQSPTSII